MKNFSAALLFVTMLALSSCSTPQPAPNPPPIRHFESQAEEEYVLKQFAIYDPAEDVNKHIYKFNAQLDEYVLLPVVHGYEYVTPAFFRRGVTNFFLNVGEVTNFTNAVLQLKPDKAGKTLGRFLINSTVGLAGTFDVATRWGVDRQPEDFGKTLGYWGSGSGAYVVMPLLGPSNVRDTVGKLFDYATLYFIIPNSVQDTVEYDVVAYGLQPIDLRYTNEFRYFSTGSPFDYELVRFIITDARNQEIINERQDPDSIIHLK